MKACTEQEVTDLVFLARNGVGRRARPQRLLERTVESVNPYGPSKEGAKQTKTAKVWSTWSEQRTRSENAALELQKAHQHSSCKRLTKATHELHQGTRARSSRTFGTPTHHPERQETIRYTESQAHRLEPLELLVNGKLSFEERSNIGELGIHQCIKRHKSNGTDHMSSASESDQSHRKDQPRRS